MEIEDRVDALERRVEALRNYLEQDREITDSVNRLDVGVLNLATVMERLDDNTRQIRRVEQTGRETVSESRRARIETRVYTALIGIVFLTAGLVVVSHAVEERERRADLERIAVQNCETQNERVDHVAQLARDLTAGSPPETKARVERVLGSFITTKSNCEALP